MNRIIKFRGKRVDGGEWVYGSLVHKEVYRDNGGIEHFLREWKEEYTYIYEENVYTNCEDYPQTFIEIIPETIGQFTGLKDKNGKEIYEGDILENFWGKDKQTLECIYYDCGLVFEDKKDYSHRCLTDAKIIGTIFDKDNVLKED